MDNIEKLGRCLGIVCFIILITVVTVSISCAAIAFAFDTIMKTVRMLNGT
jgi:hypothetical protein